MTIQERAAKVLQEIDAELALAEQATLVRHQPCGCVVCICKNEEQCQGCGASNCGTHPAGQIQNPVYETASRTGWPTALRCLKTTIEWALMMAANGQVGEGLLTTLCNQWYQNDHH